MRPGHRLSSLLFTWLLALSGLWGQDPGRLPFTILGPNQGLPSGGVICLTQDASGFLWLGTENGLVRYEGGRYRRWTTADGLPSNWVARIVPAPDGSLWVGTLRGLARLKAGRLEPAHFEGGGSLAPASLLALDKQGKLWIAGSEGLFRQEEELRFKRHAACPPGRLFSLSAGRFSESLYLAGEAGVQAFHRDGSQSHWGPAEGLPQGGTMLVAEDGQGRLWAGAGRKLAMKPPSGSAFIDQSSRLKASLSPNSSPLVEADGSIWFPTQDGALQVKEDRVEHLGASQGLPFRWVRTLFRDQEGTLWIVGPALAKLQGGGRVRNYTLSPGSPGVVVWFITRDREGRLLVATDDGAARLGDQGLEVISGTRGNRIKALTLDRSGTLWMVNTLGPTLWLRPGRTLAEVAPLGALGNSVNSIQEDTQGRIWLGHTRHGLIRWDASSRKLIQELTPDQIGVPLLGVYGFREDGQGRLWAGSSAGLLVRQLDGRWLRFSERDGLRTLTVRGLDFLRDGSAWIHYQEPNGLTRVRLEGDRLRVLEHRTQGPGLRSNAVYAVRVDEQDQPWVTTDQGLDRLDSPLHVGRHEGMASEDCAIQALLPEQGRIWVGTASGLVCFEAPREGTLQGPPQAHILQMGFGKRRLEAPFTTLEAIPFQEANLSFTIAAPSYRNEHDLRFQVRLLGLEQAWRDVEGQRIQFPGLRGGDYRFETRAALGEGPFGPAATLPFTVRPPWWQRWWALGLAVLAFGAAILGLVRLRLNALARSKAALEALVVQRTAELSERNTELSEALANVKQLSGLLPICAHCKKIRDDNGYWNQLEHYISQHSEADFSHGICPECLVEHFPQFGHRISKSK